MKKIELKENLMRCVNLRSQRVLCLITVLLLSLGLMTQANAQRTLTIKNANGQTAGVIDLAIQLRLIFVSLPRASRLGCRLASISPAKVRPLRMAHVMPPPVLRQIIMAAVLRTLIQMGLRTPTISAPILQPVSSLTRLDVPRVRETAMAMVFLMPQINVRIPLQVLL